jgi:hypothetical protein
MLGIVKIFVRAQAQNLWFVIHPTDQWFQPTYIFRIGNAMYIVMAILFWAK